MGKRFWGGAAAAALLVILLARAAAPGDAAAASGPRLPALQPVQRQVVPLPAGVTQAYMPQWAPDGRHLVFPFVAGPGVAAQLAIASPDGSGFRCLTCGTEALLGTERRFDAERPLAFGKQFPFPDGKRVMTALPGEGGDVGSFGYAVLECAPSIYRCARHTVAAIDLPGDPATAAVQNREGRISPDGRLFAWTEVRAEEGPVMAIGRLQRRGDAYAVVDARALNPPYALGEDSRGWALAGPQYELKRFDFDGRSLTYAGMGDALNYDTYSLDLSDGRRVRLTSDPEWDEDLQRAPAGGLMVQYSSRGLGRMSPFSQIERPPFIDFASFVQVGRYALQTLGVQGCMLEPWLLSASGQHGDYFGQPLNPDRPRGWRSKATFGWSPDGTRVAISELRVPPLADPAGRSQRLVVLTLPAQQPAPPRRHPPRTVFPTWAPPLASWRGIANQPVAGRVVRGLRSGTATIDLSGYFVSGTFSVAYAGYSDDGVHVIDGTESLSTGLATLGGHYSAHLTLGGKRHGSLDAELEITKSTLTGSLQSRLGGRVTGLPEPVPCPDAKSALRLRVVGSEPAGAGRRLRVAVDSKPLSDSRWRPVRGALVRAGGGAARSGGDGVATLAVPARPLRLRGQASGFRPGSVSWRP